MANVYTACWTMDVKDIAAVGSRIDALDQVALLADTQLKIMGRAVGGAFSRMLVVPEYFFASGGAISSRSNKHATYRKLEGISARVPDLIFVAGTIAYEKGLLSTKTYNVCPILYGGHIVKKLYKSNDDGVYQVNGAFRTKTDNGKGVPVATINGLSIGMDICLDYYNDRLSGYLTANNVAEPDFHIQISGTNAQMPGRNVARVGGVYVHCDLGSKGAHGASAWRVTGRAGGNAATTRIQPDQTQVPNGVGRLMYFTTPV